MKARINTFNSLIVNFCVVDYLLSLYSFIGSGRSYESVVNAHIEQILNKKVFIEPVSTL